MKAVIRMVALALLLAVVTGWVKYRSGANDLQTTSQQLQALGALKPSTEELHRIQRRTKQLFNTMGQGIEDLDWQIHTFVMKGSAAEFWQQIPQRLTGQNAYLVGLESSMTDETESVWTVSYISLGNEIMRSGLIAREWPEHIKACTHSPLESANDWRIAGYFYDRMGVPVVHLVDVRAGSWTTVGLHQNSECGRLHLLTFTEDESGQAYADFIAIENQQLITLRSEVFHAFR